ncbi:hypothetical protein IscW_ISCW013021, partial [Ixodes scapularis]
LGGGRDVRNERCFLRGEETRSRPNDCSLLALKGRFAVSACRPTRKQRVNHGRSCRVSRVSGRRLQHDFCLRQRRPSQPNRWSLRLRRERRAQQVVRGPEERQGVRGQGGPAQGQGRRHLLPGARHFRQNVHGQAEPDQRLHVGQARPQGGPAHGHEARQAHGRDALQAIAYTLMSGASFNGQKEATAFRAFPKQSPLFVRNQELRCMARVASQSNTRDARVLNAPHGAPLPLCTFSVSSRGKRDVLERTL